MNRPTVDDDDVIRDERGELVCEVPQCGRFAMWQGYMRNPPWIVLMNVCERHKRFLIGAGGGTLRDAVDPVDRDSDARPRATEKALAAPEGTPQAQD